MSVEYVQRGKPLESSEFQEQVELAVSPGYALTHGWVVHAINGFLSAYFMEDSRFRVGRRYHELETGLEIWVCELVKGMAIQRLIKRLQVDIPPCRVFQHPLSPITRFVIDLPNTTSEAKLEDKA